MNQEQTTLFKRGVSTSMKDWPLDDQPIHKLIMKGTSAVSDSELLAILINGNNLNKPALDLAKEILQLGRNNLNELGKLSVYDFTRVKGMSKGKAAIILAAIELGRRRHAAAVLVKVIIHSSNDIAQYLHTILKDYAYEVFGVVYLNRANKINHFEIISRGGMTGTVADPRMILKKALEEQATSLVLVHNHPSGNLKPSKADEDLTAKIKEAARYFDIRVLDHIIVSEDGFFSFADEGIL